MIKLNSQYDNELKKIIGNKDAITHETPLRWLPWIGNEFEQSKLLLIGHSHYADDGDENFTRNVVIEYFKEPACKRGDWQWFFYSTSKIMGFEPSGDLEQDKVTVKRIWNTFAFMQFFQGHAGGNYGESVTACQAVYRIIGAQRAIVFYKQGYGALNNEYASEKSIEESNRLYIHHPARANISRARQDVENFLAN